MEMKGPSRWPQACDEHRPTNGLYRRRRMAAEAKKRGQV
jgi:hypothetical protein